MGVQIRQARRYFARIATSILGTVGAGVLGFDPALLRGIAQRVGTPAYVYSANLIRAQYHALHDALKDVPHRICYSVKANGNIGVLKVLKALGAGADIVSVGELRRALAAGFDADAIVFSGVGKTMLELVAALRASSITTIEALDVGGGLGVRYHNEKAPTPGAFAQAVAPPIRQAGLALVCEPGRYLVANAGVLLTKVLYRKHAGGKEFVVVDAGMTDFVRPSHYNAHHEIMPLQDGARPEELVNIVGPICESGDFLALDRKLPAVEPGEYLAVLGTGAYGFVMSSTYNQRPRPPEVLVEGDRYYVARQRETLDDLLRGEVLEPTTWYQGGS